MPMTEPTAAAAADAAPPPPATPPVAGKACGNCGTPLLGEHCYACGQPVKGLVRHFSSIVGDTLDSVFNLDTRIFRTLGPLFARPGYITREYFEGRRVRYVTPVRLFFFLAIITFFVAQLTIDVGDSIKINGNNNDAIGAATTVAAVEAARDARLATLEKTRRGMVGTPAATGIPGIEAGQKAVRETAAERIRQLQDAEARGVPPPSPLKDGFNFDVDGKPWHAKTNPLKVAWLPAFANAWLNGQMGRANGNIERLKREPGLFKDAVLSAVPTTLFVLVPVFALMLKLAYLFKRRLYMEHLIVALHSHAFLCLDLLLVLLVYALGDRIAPEGSALNGLFGWIEGLLLLWMPVYLLLMQKRVYAQGWPMTLLKYFVLGTCYSILLSFAIVASMGIGLVAM
jgi:hypothetical protein